MLTPRRSARGTGERRARVALPFGTVFGRIAEWSCGAPGWPTLTSAAALRRINRTLAQCPPQQRAMRYANSEPCAPTACRLRTACW